MIHDCATADHTQLHGLHAGPGYIRLHYVGITSKSTLREMEWRYWRSMDLLD